jgi:hypothetical protein
VDNQISLALIPESGEGKFEQGQVARFVAHVVEDAFGQTRLEDDALLTGRTFDGAGQFGAGHGAKFYVGVLKGVGERPIGEGLAHEVGAEGEDKDEG